MKYIFVNDTSKQGHFGCNGVVSEIRDLIKKFDIKEITTVETGQYDQLARASRYLREEKESVLVVVNAEGTFHDNNPFGLKVIEQIPSWIEYNHAVIVLNGTYTSLSDRYLCSISQASLVYARDMESAQVVGGKYMPDLFFKYSLGVLRRLSWRLTERRFAWGDSVSPAVAERLMRKARVQDTFNCIEVMQIPKGIRSFYRRFRSLMALRYLFKSYINSETRFYREIFGAAEYETGRYHGAVARIATGRGLSVYGSNTGKVTNMLADLKERGILDFSSVSGEELPCWRVGESDVDRLDRLVNKATEDFIVDIQTLLAERGFSSNSS